MKRVISFFLLLFFALGTCCTLQPQPKLKLSNNKISEPIVKTIWIDATFSEAEKIKIISAYKTIECSTNYSLIHFEFVSNVGLGDIHLIKRRPGIVVINTTSDEPRIKRSDEEIHKTDKKSFTLGLYIKDNGTPTVLLPRDRIKADIFYKIALHEAIHSSFDILPHSDSKEAIMFPSIDQSIPKDISNKDLEYICKYYKCEASSFSVCKGE